MRWQGLFFPLAGDGPSEEDWMRGIAFSFQQAG